MTTSLPLLLALLAIPQGDSDRSLTREQMWPAPTAADWQKPCLITWQRDFDDATALSKQTGKPILVCVNMDGEIASEHYAGIRYRQPEIAALYQPYVTVIASVYRHNPRDHDEEGRRVLCPRFGSVTCGEHIAIEPVLYEKYFEGERVAPRHIAIELDGSETYDVYYAFDTASVFAAIRDGVADRETPPDLPRGDRTLLELAESPDILDRNAVETAYLEGDRELRRQLLQKAVVTELKPLELLRLALFGLDLELARIARQALAESTSPAAVDLIAEVLGTPLQAAERDALIAALERLADVSPRAKTLARVHRGMRNGSGAVDVGQWTAALQQAEVEPPEEWSALETRLDYIANASRTKPSDAANRLDLAVARLDLAMDAETNRILAADPRTSGKYQRLMLEDARRAALDAERLGATGWRVHATIATAARNLDRRDEAQRRAEAAMPDMPTGDTSISAMTVLELFAHGRQRKITEAVVAKTEWPQQWLADVNAAYSVLGEHPLGTDQHVADHYDFLKWLGAIGRAREVLQAGLARYPESWELHDRLRGRILKHRGVHGLATVYDTMLAEDGAAPNLAWFAGYASLVAAEYHRRTPDPAEAALSYDRAIAHYERAIEGNAASQTTAEHYIALAHAGRARLALEDGDLQAALAELLASFERRPQAAASLDGLGHSPVATAKMLVSRLGGAEHVEMRDRLQAALDDLDPELLQLPEFERGGPRSAGGGRGGRRGRRNR